MYKLQTIINKIKNYMDKNRKSSIFHDRITKIKL